MIDFRTQGQLPALQKASKDWSLADSCSFASHLYNSIYYAVTMGLIREVGYDRTYEIHAHLLRHHQAHFFLDGLRKLGLDLESSDAVRCAKYHCMSNAVGGLRTGYGIENEHKAWLFYFPHTPENAWGGQAQIVHTRGNMMSDYLGWHGNNGHLLGNPGLRFVATHFICDGDAFDGGYFEDTGRVLQKDELVIQRLGELPPASVKIEGLVLDDARWPADRKAKALRNYAVTWAADRVWTVVNQCDESKDEIVQRAIQAVLYAWMPRFRSALGMSTESQAVKWTDLASFIELFHSVAGVRTEVKQGDNVSELHVEKGFGTFVGGTQTEGERHRFAQIVGKAWDCVGAHFGATVRVDDLGTLWEVRH